MLGLTVFHAGCLLRQNEDGMDKWLIVVVAVTLFIGCQLASPSRLSFVLLTLTNGNFVLNYIYSVAGCFILWFLTKRIPGKCYGMIGHLFVSISQTSLVIFASHRPVLGFIYEPLLRSLFPDVNYAIFLISSLVVLIGTGYVLDWGMTKYCPYLLGKR